MSANVDVIRGLYDAFGEGDLPGVLAAMSPDVVWNEAEDFPYADGNPYVGPDAVVEGVFARIGQEWDFWSVEIEHLLDAGDCVVMLGRYRSKHSETGRDLNAQCAHVWWLEDGTVTRFQQYANTAHTLQAMGRL